MKQLIKIFILSLLCAPLLSASTSWARPESLVADLDQDEYAIIVAEDHRDAHDPVLASALHSTNVSLVKRALIATARIGDPAVFPLVQSRLGDSDADVRRTAAFAVGMIKPDHAQELILDRLSHETVGTVRGELYQALGRLQHPESLAVFSAFIVSETDYDALSGLGMGLTFLLSAVDAPTWDVPATIFPRLYTWVQVPESVSISAAWALARYKGDLTKLNEQTLTQVVVHAQNPSARSIVVRALARFKTDATRQTLLQLVANDGNSGVRIEAVRGLVGQPVSSDTELSLLNLIHQGDAMIAAECLTTIGAMKTLQPDTKVELQKFTHDLPSPWLRSQAFAALVATLDGNDLRIAVLSVMQETDPYFRRQVLTVLPRLGAEGLAILVQQLSDSNLLIASAALSALHDVDEAQMTAEIKSAMLAQLNRHDSVMTGTIVDAAGKFGWKDALPQLLAVANEPWKIGDYGVHAALMTTFATFADPSTLTIIEQDLRHPVRNIVVEAAKAYTKITGRAPASEIPLNNAVTDATPPLADMNQALHSSVELQTTKGLIELEMLSAAPITATKFQQWVVKGFYNGLVFHRAVPHFVVQGGDPRGDGEGGDGLIRDEVSMADHGKYTVGIATAGKDTGSTQIFFNLEANTRLNGAYTVFATVINGKDVVDHLELGDRIVSARVVHN